MNHRWLRLETLAGLQRAPILSMAVMLGLFVVHTGGHLTFVFHLTRPGDLVLVCLHFVIFIGYTLATLVCLGIYGIMVNDGRIAETRIRQVAAEARAGRLKGLADGNSHVFTPVVSRIPLSRTGIRIGLETLALGLMFLSRDMRLLHEVNWIDGCTAVSGGLAFLLAVAVVEAPFWVAAYCCRTEIRHRRQLCDHAGLDFTAGRTR